MSKENTKVVETAEEIITPTEEIEESPLADEIIEVGWEKVKEAYNIRSMLRETEDYMGKMFVDFEKRKKSLLLRSAQLEEELYRVAAIVKEEQNVTNDFTYELKLPQKPGDKGYFVRKDE